MAGAGYKLFATGDVLTAAQVNTYLNEQTVMVFADSAARTTALSGVLAEGMMSYLQDTNAVEVYNGSSWVNVGNAGDITEVQAGVGISVASGTGPIPVITNSSTDLITTAGDLLYGTAADTVARLGIGTASQVLAVNSGATAPEWVTPAAGGSTFVGVVARKIVSQSVTSGSSTAVTFTKEIIDTDGFHSNVTNTSRFTIPSGKDGKYMIAARAHYQSNSSAQRRALIYKNGVEVDGAQTFAGGDQATCQITSVLDLVATDYIELFAYQNSGSTLDVFGDDNGFTSVQMYLIGA